MLVLGSIVVIFGILAIAWKNSQEDRIADTPIDFDKAGNYTDLFAVEAGVSNDGQGGDSSGAVVNDPDQPDGAGLSLGSDDMAVVDDSAGVDGAGIASRDVIRVDRA